MREEEDRDYEEEGSEEEGSEEEELREGLEEDFTADEASEMEPEAVDLPEVLRLVLDGFCDEKGKPLPEGHHKYREFTKGKLWEAMLPKLGEFCDSLLHAMAGLPTSPGRCKLSDKEETALRAQFRPVWRSFRAAKALLGVVCHAAYARTGKRLAVTVMISKYISAVTGECEDGSVCRPYGIYKPLDSWLFRRTDAYRKWAKSYYGRPDVRARKAKNRPDKKAEAERKRKAYYASKGILEPPPKRVKGAVVGTTTAVAKPKAGTPLTPDTHIATTSAAAPAVGTKGGPVGAIDAPSIDRAEDTMTPVPQAATGTPAQSAPSETDMTPLSVIVGLVEPEHNALKHASIGNGIDDGFDEVFANM
jgi:hypothetical protein